MAAGPRRRGLRDGIPSHDVLARVLAALHPDHSATAFERLVTPLPRRAPALADRHIAIGGEALRGPKNRAKRMVHSVGARATNAGVASGQVPTDDKSDEVTATPKLPASPDPSGAPATTGAAGCPTGTATRIASEGGDRPLQVEGDRERLHDDGRVPAEASVGEGLAGPDVGEGESPERRHGRRESRTCFVIDDPILSEETIRDVGRRGELRSVAATVGEREADGVTGAETRCHIGGRRASAAAFGAAVRRHRTVENGCHRVLDVAFREDDHRLREGHAAANLSAVRRTALSAPERSRAKLGIEDRRLKAGYDNAFLESLLAEVFKDFDA